MPFISRLTSQLYANTDSLHLQGYNYNKNTIKHWFKTNHTSELSKEAVADQPQQGFDVQLEFLFSQVDA